MKTTLLMLAVLAILGGCSDETEPPVIWGGPEPAGIEFRASSDWPVSPLTAPADSTVETGIGVIVRDQQGVTVPDAVIVVSTDPPAVLVEPDSGKGAGWFRIVLHVPPDTTECVLTAKSGSAQQRLTLTLIGE